MLAVVIRLSFILSNFLLLIFFQLGGLNSMLAVEQSPSIPMISKAPTLILGMDVSHGSPGQSDIPSIAAVMPRYTYRGLFNQL